MRTNSLGYRYGFPRNSGRDAPVSYTHLDVYKRQLPASDAERMCVALERTNSVPVFFEVTEPPDSKAISDCHLAVVNVRPEMVPTPWLQPGTAYTLPLVFAGGRDHLLSLDRNVQALACEFLMDSWQPEEALVRLSLALSHRRASTPQKPAAAASTAERTRVVIADDDPTVLALVRSALANFGMECYTAVDGPSALETIRRYRPHAAVLDVNMPGLDLSLIHISVSWPGPSSARFQSRSPGSS